MKNAAEKSTEKNTPPIGKPMVSVSIKTPEKVSQPIAARDGAKGFTGCRLDQNILTAGRNLAIDMFNDSDFSPVKRFQDDANASNEDTKTAGLSMLLGVGMGLSSGLAVVKDAKLVNFCGGSLPTDSLVIYAFRTDANLFSSYLKALIGAAKAVKEKVPTIRMSRPGGHRNAEKRGDDEKPLQVEIVGMPARARDTVIGRDDKGEIISSIQIERDSSD